MPNTIAHFAVAGVLTRTLIKNADFKWIYLGCVLPDLPWIAQRIVSHSGWVEDKYDIRAYAITQSSLIVCLVLSFGLACFAQNTRRVFAILAFGSFVHLLLDATQIKWANGVSLLVPLDWDLLGFDFFWPESLWTYLMTLLGLIYFAVGFVPATAPTKGEFRSDGRFALAGVAAIVAWFILPLLWLDNAYTNDNHYISTLKSTADRSGKYIEIDRNRFGIDAARPVVHTAFGESIFLTGANAYTVSAGDTVSIQGRFTDNTTVLVQDFHVHSKLRDRMAIVGLFLVLLTWLTFTLRLFLARRCARTQS